MLKVSDSFYFILFYFIRYQAATASSSAIYQPPRPGIRSHYSAGQGVSVGSPYSGFTKERGNRMRKLRAKEKYRFSRKILYCHIGNRATIRPYKEMKLLSDTTTYFGQRNSRRSAAKQSIFPLNRCSQGANTETITKIRAASISLTVQLHSLH